METKDILIQRLSLRRTDMGKRHKMPRLCRMCSLNRFGRQHRIKLRLYRSSRLHKDNRCGDDPLRLQNRSLLRRMPRAPRRRLLLRFIKRLPILSRQLPLLRR